MTTRASTGALPAQLQHEAPHAGVASGEAVVVDQVLPDRHRVAAPLEPQLDELAVRLAGARRGRATKRWHRGRPRLGVGGHLRRGGRFCRPVLAPIRPPRPRTAMPAAFR